MKEDVRVLARKLARELTPEECDAIGGGGYSTYSGSTTCWDQYTGRRTDDQGDIDYEW